MTPSATTAEPPRHPPGAEPQASLHLSVMDLLGWLSVSVTLVDACGDFVFCNPAAAELFRQPGGRRIAVGVREAALTVHQNRRYRGEVEKVLDVGRFESAVERCRIRCSWFDLMPEAQVVIATAVLEGDRTRPLPAADELAAAYGLTPREAEVALLLARGRSATGIAADLGIAWNTARRHSERVLGKLGVRSRAEVGALLLGIRVERPSLLSQQGVSQFRENI